MSAARTSRRSFIGATGLALSAPLAGLGASASHATTGPSPADVQEIRLLIRGHAIGFDVNEEGRRIVSLGFGADDSVDIGSDERSATAFLYCTAEFVTDIGPDCPLLEMARQQGGGVTRHTEHGVIEFQCVKDAGVWTVRHAAYRPASAEPAGAHKE